MSWENRTKYMEDGTGQVFYLYQDDQSKSWIIAMFVGGPAGVQPVSHFESRKEAEEQLERMQCRVVA
jgi:hypothetical protein